MIKKSASLIAIAVAATLVASSATPVFAVTPKHHASSLAAAKQPLPNFHTVAPGIYRGGVPSDAGLQKLKAMGVKTIIDLRISPKRVKKEGETARAMGFTWMNLPMGAEPPTKKQVAALLATLNSASPQNPVFVHCEHGADRSGCMIGIYRETHDGWDYAKTFAEMRKYGFNPHWRKLSGAVAQYAPAHR